ncbi:hypothetical protein DB31_3249 [Hyalangium minutum]|uniref:Uncharacterized protein n=1 Tax=Hyalangium minutum TaxID=394096 RepID=A0A085WTV6_9BACT|nr:hypothetical protein DB31_3249 [Hyalangium minutum]
MIDLGALFVVSGHEGRKDDRSVPWAHAGARRDFQTTGFTRARGGHRGIQGSQPSRLRDCRRSVDSRKAGKQTGASERLANPRDG